ncbi:hypothetical protein [Methylocucumis oryzae]|uniref:Chemotaxis protein n=1 Tax=Methylocucumis oryzae TaxID=1632867 RepID=A0A0F3II98_9GAMM|nr:hypothetical protein [Methylocucumis oryzae]KJV06471.1 hypothetical protein VZ94_10875 [Methylocucumis oryzae]
MSPSNSKKPDLDWSQVRETVKLLSLSAIQVDELLKDGDNSVNVLTESFTIMAEHMLAINNFLLSMEACEIRDKALVSCSETSDKIQSSIVAFQFYDRMVQCLQHVTSNLLGLTQLLESPERLYNPTEWSQFQSEIRARYTMESEKVLFDAIIEGRPLDEIKQEREAMMTPNEDNIELF